MSIAGGAAARAWAGHAHDPVRVLLLDGDVAIGWKPVGMRACGCFAGTLQTALEPLIAEEGFDFVLFDCPPSLGLLSLNALTSAREVFIPLQTQFFALQGMTRLIEVIDLIRTRIGHDVEVTGIVPTLYDTRTRLSQEVVQEIRDFFQDRVFETVVHTNVKLAESPSHGQTIFDYAPDSRGAQDYEALASEILERGLVQGGIRPVSISE